MKKIVDIYKALRKQGYSKSHSMERILHFARREPRLQRKLISKMLKLK